jgi:hypothetical protein
MQDASRKEVTPGYVQSFSFFTVEVLRMFYYLNGLLDDVGVDLFPFHTHSPEDGNCSVCQIRTP